jgi:RNA polymerase sigma-32 factor
MGKLDGERGRSAFNATNNLIALEAPTDESGQTFSERIADKQPNPEEIMIQETLQEEYKRLITRALFGLTPREQKVIVERKLTEPPRTLEEISVDLKLTRERVRQIEINAMKKMAATLSDVDGAAHF